MKLFLGGGLGGGGGGLFGGGVAATTTVISGLGLLGALSGTSNNK